MKFLKQFFVMTALAVPSVVSAGGYVSAKLGVMDVGFDDVEVDSNPSSFGLTAGYRFDSLLQGLSAEFEFTRGIASGEVIGLDLDVESQGAYIAYQTSGQFYLKGRLGLMDAGLVAGSLSEDEGGESYGLAAGYRIEPFAIELDITSIDDDITFMSLGVVWSL